MSIENHDEGDMDDFGNLFVFVLLFINQDKVLIKLLKNEDF